MIELRFVRHGIALLQRARADTEECADVTAEAVRLRPVRLHRGLRVGPGAVEQTRDAMMKNIGKSRQRRICEVVPALVRVLRDVQGQGPVWTEQAEENAPEPQVRGAALRLDCLLYTSRCV